MSAYIVEQQTIGFIVQSAIGYGLIKRGEAIKTANMLWKENKKSIEYRYSHSDDLKEYSKIGRFRAFGHLGTFKEFVPLQVINSCNNLDYQSCEHPTWRDSDACKLLDIIIAKANRLSKKIVGEPIWGSPKPVTIKRIDY